MTSLERTLWAVPLVLSLQLPVSSISAPTVTRRDSAGVTIVDVRVPARMPTVAIDPNPLAIIGGLRENPDEELNLQRGQAFVIRDRTGFVVADGTRLFRVDSSGRLLKRLGGRGAGPGEFRMISGICRIAGDTIVALDTELRRASLFAPDGQYLRTVPTPGMAMRQACLADGSIISHAGEVDMAASRDRGAPHVLVNSRTSRTTPIGELPVQWTGLISRLPSVVGSIDRIYTADGTRMEYDIRSSSGKIITRVRTSLLPKPITKAQADARLKSMVPAQGAEMEARIRAFMTRQPTPSHWPMLGRLFVAPNRSVWATETDETGRIDSWLYFAADGALRGRLTLPKDIVRQHVQMIGVGNDEVYIQYLDADDVPTVAVYRVRGPGGR